MKKKEQEIMLKTKKPEIPQPPAFFDRTNNNYSVVDVLIDRKPVTNILDSSKIMLKFFRGDLSHQEQ